MLDRSHVGLTRCLAKMERRVPLPALARAAFLNLKTKRHEYEAQRDIIREGDVSSSCLFLESGIVSGSKMVPSGGRQIVAFHLEGDLLGIGSALLPIADHSLRAHVRSVIHSVSDIDILRLSEDYPEIGRAFWFETLVDASIFREWNLNVGRRGARERLAHLLMEIGYRSEVAGIDAKDDYACPISQADLADALGLTAVHVNRCFQWLRNSGHVKHRTKRVIIKDWDALADFASFRPLYLHPEGPRTLQSIN